jgi:hypothetical protein
MIELLGSLFSNALAVTVLVILVTSLVGFYVNMRGRDRCLRDLDGFQVTIETKDAHVAWGTLRTYATGVELLYIGADPGEETPPLSPPRKARGGEEELARPRAASSPSSPVGSDSSSPSPVGLTGEGRGGGQDAVDRYTKHSYILYANELPRVECFYRFHDHQTEAGRWRREREIRRTYQPSLWRRFTRTARNLLTTFKDAIVQTLNVVLGARAAASPQSPVLNQHKDLTASGAQLVESAVGSAYDPILEHYIGQYVVLEMQNHGEVGEEHGILKEYSTQYIELLNVRVEVPLYIYMRRRPHVARKQVRVAQDGPVARVSHDLPYPIVVETLCAGDAERELDLPVAPGKELEIALSEAEAATAVSFTWGVRCLADLVVPRTLALVRHAGKQEKLTWEAWLGLDDLHSPPWLKRLVRARRDQALPLMYGAQKEQAQ